MTSLSSLPPTALLDLLHSAWAAETIAWLHIGDAASGPVQDDSAVSRLESARRDSLRVKTEVLRRLY